MSKSVAISIIILVILALTGGLLYWYFFAGNSTKNQDGSQNNSGFFPFPTGGGDSTSNQGNDGEGGLNPTASPRIRMVSGSDTSGFASLVVNGEQTVRYIDKETGNIFDAPLSTVSKTRISNTTLPRIREALWFPSANKFIARFTKGNSDTIQSYSAGIIQSENEGEEGEIDGVFLRDNIVDIKNIPSTSSSGQNAQPKIMFSTENSQKTSVFVGDADGTKTSEIFSINLPEWFIYPIDENKFFFASKPSYSIPGFMFEANSKTGSYSSILRNRLGLIVNPSDDGSKILFSETTNGGLDLRLLDRKTNTVKSFALSTLATKCTFDKRSSSRILCAVPEIIQQDAFMDSYFRGETFSIDEFWEINSSTGESKQIATPSNEGYLLDAENISTSEDGTYILFTNKRDGTLWSINSK